MSAPTGRLTAAEAKPPLLAALTCGCGRGFVANARMVPVIADHPVCRPCWDRINDIRARGGLPVWGRPKCYPEEYTPQEIACQSTPD